ncbi:hypothetical protein HAT94_02204 [Dickeya solani]|nr:hypothetical protein [Dickeya solani]
MIVNHDTAAHAYLQPGLTRQPNAWANTGGKQYQIGFQRRTIGEVHAVARLLARRNSAGFLAGMYMQTQRFNLALQQLRAAAVQLYRHQPGGELHHMGFQPQLAQCIGGFQPQQPAAYHHAAARFTRFGGDGVQIVQRAIYQTTGAIVARHRRHKRVGTGRQHQPIVRGFLTARVAHTAALAIDCHHLTTGTQLNTGLLEKAFAHHRQRFGAATGKILGQMYPVIGRMAFFAKHHHVILLVQATFHQLLQKVVPDHAVPHYHQYGFTHDRNPYGRRPYVYFRKRKTKQKRRRCRWQPGLHGRQQLRAVADMTEQQRAA